MDAPAGVTQKEGRTGFLHLPSAVLRDLIAISHSSFTASGYQSRHRMICLLFMILFTVSGFTVSCLTTLDFILKYCGGGTVPFKTYIT